MTAKKVVVSPASSGVDDAAERDVADGWALSMSGGGYRAMLFHLGVIWRLNEAGWLTRFDRISSVSGGSITAGVLAAGWQHLEYDDSGTASNLVDVVADPLRRLARMHADVTSVVGGLLSPWSSIADEVSKIYDKHLFHGITLQGLPDAPLFMFNATNLASGALFRFSKPYLGDWRVGRVFSPDLKLAAVVACSSAFPPFHSPYHLDMSGATWVTEDGNDLTSDDFRNHLSLSDGGVYDNLGIETVWKNFRGVIVSDAGGLTAPDASPPNDWGRHMLRVLHVIDHQVRSLRKRDVIAGYKAGERPGAYVGIRSKVANYQLKNAMLADPAITAQLANVPTRLDKLDGRLQEQLINWGYVICDAGLRKHVDSSVPKGSPPYPNAPLTSS